MMWKGKPGDWYEDEHIAGYYDSVGDLIVCVEKGLTDADTDRYAVEVQNGEGYYDSDGHYRSYGRCDD